MEPFKNKAALVTGASSGLGVDFATLLSEQGCRTLVLVARREDRLQALRKQLIEKFDMRVEVVVQDLIAPDGVPKLYDAVKTLGIAPDILINNAGFAVFGNVLDQSWESSRNMIELNIIALTHLSWLYGKDMAQRGGGHIMQIASVGAFQPAPEYAVYGATKAYVLSFGEALAYELRKANVKVTVVCPGITATEFFEVAGQKPTAYHKYTSMESRQVAEMGLNAMVKGQASIITGGWNKFSIWAQRLMPRKIMPALAHLVMKN